MRKIGLFSLLTVATLLFTMAFPAAAAGPKPPASPVPSAPVVATPTPTPEPHPQIHDALEAMRNAKNHLQHADHDFDGHRIKAIEHLDQAIREAEICMSMK